MKVSSSMIAEGLSVCTRRPSTNHQPRYTGLVAGLHQGRRDEKASRTALGMRMAHQAGTLDIFEGDVEAKVRHDDATVAPPARARVGVPAASQAWKISRTTSACGG